MTLIEFFPIFFFFFFNDTATTEIYTLSLHDALPIWLRDKGPVAVRMRSPIPARPANVAGSAPSATPSRVISDRKSTRLNSSHSQISYAVFCLKKKHRPACSFVLRMQLYSVRAERMTR